MSKVTRKQGMTYDQTTDQYYFDNPSVILSDGNQKTGPCKTFNTRAGICGGCNPAAPCLVNGICYALYGNFKYDNVKCRLSENMAAYKADPDQFERDVMDQTNGYMGFFRWFSSGDIPDFAFLEMMARIAEARPDVRFLAFTKKYSLVNAYLDQVEEYLECEEGFTSAPVTLPDNLVIVFSYWQGWPCDNPHNLPAALVILKGPKQGKGRKRDLIPDPRLIPSAFACTGRCMPCNHLCWYLKAGQQICFTEHN